MLVLKNVGNIAHDVFVHADIDQLESQTDKYTMVNGILYCDGVLIRCFDKNISGFTVPKHVTRVCTAAFENMSKLTQVEVAHSSVTFEKGVFTNCKNLRKFELTDIENNCFDELFDDAASITFLVYNGKSIKRKFFSHNNKLLEIADIGDRAYVFAGNKLVKIMYVNDGDFSCEISLAVGEPLTIVVENMGRTNFGSKMMRKKGHL